MGDAPTPDQLREYLDRPWSRVRRAKEAFWAQQAREESATERLAMSSQLWSHARAVDPEFLGDTQRASDLAHHVRLAEKLRAVAHVFAGR
jgi:hypothetical protein